MGIRPSEESKEKNRLAHLGKKHTEESKKKMSEFQKGRKVSEETRKKISVGNKGKKRTEEVREKNRLARLGKKASPETIEKIRESSMGPKNASWKGGVTPLYICIRCLPESINWRKKVFERDNYTCRFCGEYGGYVHAHHIDLFSSILADFLSGYPSLSPENDREDLIRLSYKYEPFWNIENGITLCAKCHKAVHKYIHRLKKEENILLVRELEPLPI